MAARLVTLCTYQYAVQAEIAKWALAEDGIRAYIGDASTITADWFLGPALGWIKLQVSDADAEAAVAILKSHPRLTHPYANPANEGDLAAACMACGIAMGENADRCTACGWSYLDDGGEAGEPEK